MSKVWQKGLLFSIYFIFTSLLPVLSLKILLPVRWQQESVIIIFSAVVILFYIALFEWKLMPNELSKIMIWFIPPFLMLIFNLLFFGIEVTIRYLRIDGIALSVSILFALLVISLKKWWFKSKKIKENIDKFKTPFLQSYWKKKYYKSLFNEDDASVAVSILLLAVGGLLFCGYIFIQTVPYPENHRILWVFVLVSISNILAFQKVSYSKYEP